jgi:hypothetical protein
LGVGGRRRVQGVLLVLVLVLVLLRRRRWRRVLRLD